MITGNVGIFGSLWPHTYCRECVVWNMLTTGNIIIKTGTILHWQQQQQWQQRWRQWLNCLQLSESGKSVNVVHFDNNKVTYHYWVSHNNFHDRFSIPGALKAKTKLKKKKQAKLCLETTYKLIGKITASSAR